MRQPAVPQRGAHGVDTADHQMGAECVQRSAQNVGALHQMSEQGRDFAAPLMGRSVDWMAAVSDQTALVPTSVGCSTAEMLRLGKRCLASWTFDRFKIASGVDAAP